MRKLLSKRRQYTSQLNEVFNWLGDVVRENDIIHVILSGHEGYFYFAFPLKYGDRPKKIVDVPKGTFPTFIIRVPEKDNPNLNKWATLFRSPELEVLESKERTSNIKPLRWGLNLDEKKEALSIARSALEKSLSDDESDYFDLKKYFPKNAPNKFSYKTDLDVSIWIKGQLRGSMVLEKRSLSEGIVEAVLLASRDPRFKPVALSELSEIRIEIHIMSDLHIPLSTTERERNAIYPEKGYVLEYKNKKGWFIPGVFNVKRFKDLAHLLQNLAEEKAGVISNKLQRKSQVSIFEVESFIESKDLTSVLTLNGPVVRHVSGELSDEEITACMMRAANWLILIQEEDGNIPPIINPLTGVQTQIDWTRLAFTSFALAEYGKAVNEKKYTRAAEKSYKYLYKNIFGAREITIRNPALILAYTGQLALSLGKTSNISTIASRIINLLGTTEFDPITYSQIATFFIALKKCGYQYMQYIDVITTTLRERFENTLKNETETNLSLWAELVHTFYDFDREFSDRVSDWLKRYQLNNGAFQESTISPFSYTRGTGKIFEVLALDYEKNRKKILHSLEWLCSMQYSIENTFFVRESVRPKIIGGFRHDYINQDVWIDAAGHLLLGGARICVK